MTDRAENRRAAALGGWLAERLGSATPVEVGPFDRPASGFSAETLIVPVTSWRDGVEHHDRYVVRIETPDPAIYPPQAPDLDVEIRIQYRVMEALAGHADVPLAPLVGYEPDPGVLGAPFFVMGFVEGVVPLENPIYTSSGFFTEAQPADRRRMLDDGLGVLARVHAVDWRAAQLEWLVAPGTTPGIGTQVELWERTAGQALDGRSHPLLDRGFAWLHAHPPAARPVTLCWGDPRPGNIIWRDYRAVCATDFEAASIGSGELDLGWWLMFDRWSHEVMGAARLPGEPTREEQRDRYCEAAGRDVGDTFFFEVFAAVRYTVIVVIVMNRMVARGDLPADQTIWLENPAVDCLVQLLDG
jgi:aminoglycoside phosphotransferase (APT) family kinase protein